MPASVVKQFASKYAEREGIEEETALEKLEVLWDRAKSIAKKKFEEENSPFWAYVMGIWKRMVKFEGSTSEASACNMAKIKIRM